MLEIWNIGMKTKHLYLLVALVIVSGAFLAGYGASGYKQSDEANEPLLSKSVCDEAMKVEEILPIEKFNGTPARVDFSLMPEARSYYTAITSQVKEGPNLAGHFTFVEWGCGTECAGYAIVDAITGKVLLYDPANEEGNSWSHAIDSRILVHNEKDDFKSVKGLSLEEIITHYGEHRKPREYYKLIERADEGYGWIIDELWLNKLCSENVYDGLYSL